MVFLERREFNDIINNPKYVSPYWIPVDRLTLSALQIFASRYMNPQDQQVYRLLLKVGTGIGKTLTSLEIARPFIKIFHHLYAKAQEHRHIAIIGYARQVFIRELLKYPELGIITYDELYKKEQLQQRIANATGINKERFKADLSKFMQRIKKRITSEVLGGMYKFYGYKHLVGQLFDQGLPEHATQSNIFELYESGEIKVNKIVLSKFKNGVIICDEVHLIYNSKEINNYGLAIQFILDYYGKNVTFIALSATILNNKAREVIDIANLIRDPGIPRFRTEDYFSNDKPIKSLTPLIDAFTHKTIFLEESTSDYPTLVYKGDAIQGVDYLKFIFCPMSPLHQQTYLLDNLDSEKTKNFMIHDMVLPNPEIPVEDLRLFHPDTYYKLSAAEKRRISHYKGLYDSDIARKIIKVAPEEWKKAVGIDVRELANRDYVFFGNFLRYENLQIYSTKKCMLLQLLADEFKANPLSKVLNYHPYVKSSGISNTQEVLKYNHYIGYFDIPKSDTISAEEYLTQDEWIKKYPNREFYPSKIVALDSEVTDTKKDDFIDEFNSKPNKFGRQLKIFIGSQKIRQSVDFKGVQFQVIEQCPTNIPELIQIKGRTVRKNALEGMPPNMKTVKLNIMCSTYSKPGKLDADLSRDTLEMAKFRKKVEEFKLIQQIEYEINRNACNAHIFYSHGFQQSDVLGAKSFKPVLPSVGELTSATYFGHNYYELTLREFTNVIKQAFISNAVWTYDNLWEFCSKTDMSNINLATAKDIYNVALKKLIFMPRQSLINMPNIVIFDFENYIIDKYYINGVAYSMPRKVIIEMGKYYILTIVDQYGNPQIEPYSFLSREYKNIYNQHVLDEKKLKIPHNYIKKIIDNYERLEGDAKEYFHYLFLLEFPAEIHYYVMHDVIEIKHKAKKMDQLPKKFCDTYKKLGMMGKNWYIDSSKKNSFERGRWESYAIPPDIRPDNDIIVGIIEDENFKLKQPVLTEQYIRDKRTVERGMVCTSHVKEHLAKILAQLKGVKPKRLLTQSLCNQIFIRLIDLEGISRESKNPKRYIIFNR